MVRASPLALEALLRLLGQWRRGVPASCLVAGGWSLHELRAVVLAIVFGWGPRAGCATCAALAGPAPFRLVSGVDGPCRWAGWGMSRFRIERLLAIELLFG